MKPQLVCIDLPGESVDCWRSTDKVRVVLKKHRDIIFELSLSSSKKYTVESSGSDFYDADKKKLIAGENKQRVLFNDGERVHLWVARDFNGELMLKSNGQLIMKIEPTKLDPKRYGNDPVTKPDPIIISLGGTSRQLTAQFTPGQQATKTRGGRLPMPVTSSAATMDEECAIVCVVDGDIKEVPEKILKVIANGGGQSGFADLDPNNIATRNWLLAQLAGAAAFVGDNWDWLRASIDGKTHAGFRLVRAKIHFVKGKVRYYFSGYSKQNKVFKAGGFGPGHERVLSIFSGTGKLSSTLAATAKGISGAFKTNALVSFVFSSAVTMAEWKSDINKDGYDLAAALFMNVVKAILGAALTAIIVTIFIAIFMIGAGASISVLAIGGLTVVAGFAAGYLVDLADKELGRAVAGESNSDGLSAVMSKHVREHIQTHWYFLKRKLLWDYEESVF